MFELIFLGTSAAAPTIYRGLTSQMLLAQEHRFMVDCGEGTQRQVLKSGLGFKRLNKILLTHAHLDHILGIGGLLSTLTRWEDLTEIEIWGAEPTLLRVQNLINEVVFLGQLPPIPIFYFPLESGVFWDDKKFTVSAFPVKHQGIGNYGFCFQERTHHPFLAEKAEGLGIPSGPIRGQLVAGKSVMLPDGRLINPSDVLGEPLPGVKYVHVGDCGNPDSLYEVAADADCLVMEATYVDADREMANQFGHMTAGDSARFARDAGVKNLILNHVSRRNREFEVREEAQRIFPNTYVARDFDHFIITRDKLQRKTAAASEDE